ncbi:MAG: PAS domain S-box protein [Burkholderiales bacterium]|nr:PAS domain S-box protein [Burkholderiales bacterium]
MGLPEGAIVAGTQSTPTWGAMPRFAGIVAAAVGIALSAAAWLGVKQAGERRIEARFHELAAARAERVGFELERYRDDLVTLAGHIAAADSIDAATFDRMAGARIETLRGLQSLAWVVPARDPAPQPQAGTSAHAADGDAALGSADAHSPLVYRHVVSFAQPSGQHAPIAGRALSLSVAQRALFERARVSGEPVVSPPLRTQNYPYEAPLYRTVVAVHIGKRGAAPEPATVRGYLVGTYRAQDAVESALLRAHPPLALRVTDLGEAVGTNLLAIYDRPTETASVGMSIQRAHIAMDTRLWELEFAPTDEFVQENRTDEAMLALLLGLALTAAATAAAFASARWRHDILDLVAQRTSELAASEARQRAVIAYMADALVVTDSGGVIESVNAAAQRLFGWDAAQLIGRDVSMLVADADELARSAGDGEWVEQVSLPHFGHVESLATRRDGSTFPVAVALSQVREQGRVRRIALMRDVSQERRAERAMSLLIAGTSNVTGRAFLDAATRSLAQALGVRYAFIAEAGATSGELHIVSLWSGERHEPGRSYPLAGKPCAEVFAGEPRCHADRLLQLFPRANLMRELNARSYVGHPLRAADGRALGILALMDVNPLAEAPLAASLLSLAASRVSAEMERLESDQALLISRERVELALEGSQLALWDLNVSTGAVFLSERWAAMMGQQPAVMLTSLAELFARVNSEDRNAVDRAFRGALIGASPFYEVTHRVMREDGTYVWVRSHGKVSQRDGHGRALRMVGTNADVTWEKTAVEEVARRERELRAISDNVPAVIVRLDRQLRYLYANQRYARVVGVFAEELRGKHIADVLGAASFRQIEAHFMRALDGETVTYERELSVAGERRWLEVTVIPDADADWAVHGCLAIGIDVTERKEIERRMVEARRNAEDTARAKSEFLAMMSHEIRTPMNGVIGLAGLLLDSDLNAEQRGYAETLHRSASGLLDILNDVLDMSKIEAGKLALQPEPFDLTATVEDVAALWAPKAAAKTLDLAVEMDALCPRRVVGDAGRIRQVLGNLIGNAVKFTAAGHVLVRVAAAGEASRIRFEVSDTGVGVSEEQRRRLFQPFSQADASTTRRFGGTGLGLAICRRLVELMEGEIGVESEPDRGSTFWFNARLPAAAGQALAAPSALDGAAVLVVDDHRCSRRALVSQLATLAMQARACDAGEVHQRLRAGTTTYRAVLIAQDIRGMDGMELGRRLDADPSLRSIPRVLLASGAQRIDATQAQAAGFAAVMGKPARTDALRRLLEALLSGRADAEMGKRPEHGESPQRLSGRVLLVEDNEVNRRVAASVLARLGLEVGAATNGREALAKLQAERFDLVLMDMHMPEMDGLEATREIRRREHGRGSKVPVVAMTANVLPEARAACLDAGMDDFLPKPLVRAQLVTSLQRWLPRQPTGGAAEVVPLRRDVHDQPLDYERLADLHAAMGADLAKLMDVFLASALDLVRAMQAAVQAHAGELLGRHAHTLKSSAANVGATQLSRLARQIESDARGGPLDQCAAYVAELERELERVRPLLLQGVVDATGQARTAAR